ncbi:MAG: 3-isopropylmalate dehydrogenase, partial [bacterium]|nr:3-isopropylmalate dehydrogenase [bacterium]
MTAKVLLLPGDGVGPEIVDVTRRVLERVASDHDFELSFDEAVVGGAAIDAVGDPLPPETLAACHAADAVLLGAVGGPKWSDPSAPVRPEQGLLKLRREFDLFANLRPVQVFPALAGHAPLRPDLLDGVDILFVRELTSGIYFGKSEEENASGVAYDTMSYSVSEVERIAHVAFAAARRRQGRVASVDKANVLASMRLWRRTVDRVAKEYPDVELEHVLVDACAMFLMRRPASFDVVLAGNCFGDILSDEAATLAGSLGLLPSASLGTGSFGVYEPIHGSAPDIAGQGIANPVATLLSAAMMLRYSFSLEEPARAIEEAVAAALDSGLRT